MLDFVIFAFTAVLGLIVILLFFFCSGGNEQKGKVTGSPVNTIPRWEEPPADKEQGDLGVMMTKYGSLHGFLVHLHDQGKSPVSSFWWGDTHVVSFCSPQAFKESTGFVNRPPKLFWGFEPLITKHSIQYANDDDWAERQKWLFPKLKNQELKSYFPHFVQIAQEAESKWDSYSANDEIQIQQETFPIAIKGIARSCLGDIFDDETELQRLTESYHFCWQTMERGGFESGSEKERDFLRHHGVMMDIIKRILTERREGSGNEYLPFIESMMKHYDSDDKIVADAISFMVGGFHTSGYMMTWMYWYLADNQESQDRLAEEIQQETGGECGDRLKQYALRSDTFLRQVQDETIRLSTLAPWAARFSYKEETICGYTIPKGTPMIHSLGVALKNQTVWKNPEKWDPDRFDPSGRRGNEFCPFGVHGKRKCPGYQFSYFEVGVVTSVLLGKYRIKPVPGQNVIQVHGLVTEPQEPIRVFIQHRVEG